MWIPEGFPARFCLILKETPAYRPFFILCASDGVMVAWDFNIQGR
jgi:hypothetical protein